MERGRNTMMILAIIALIVGGIIGYALKGNKGETNDKTAVITSSAANLRTKLSGVLREHAALTVPALEAQAMAEPDVNEASAAVDMNSELIADAVEELYNGKRAEFLDMWRQHITYYKDYMTAAQTNNEEGKQTAKDNLTDFAEELSNFFADANPRFNRDTLKASIAQHGDQVIALIDALVANNFEDVYSLSHEAYEHMGEVADTLSRGIVEQMPDKF